MESSKTPIEAADPDSGAAGNGPTGPVRRARRSEQPSGSTDKLAAPVERPEYADLLPPKYKVRAEVGRGGMGVVYRAFDTQIGREVAVKVLPESSMDESQTKRFQREVADLAGMSHPNIVGYYGAGTHKGRDFLVMELVTGGNLHRYLKDRAGTLTILEILKIFAQMSDALEHIHGHGLVHRDFKPENVLMTTEGVPKVTDFGLARKLEEGRSRLTSVGTILGTYTYLAPEQIMSSDVGPPADLYALGCCLYEALTGKALFTGETEFTLLNSHLREVPVSPRALRPDISPDLEALVLRLVKKSPEERPRGADEVARQLRSIAGRLTPNTSREERKGLVGRQEVIKHLETSCRKVLDGQKVFVNFVAPNGLGRSVVVRETVAILRAAGIRCLLCVPLYDTALPLRDAYVSLGGDAARFHRRLRHGGPSAAAQLLRDQMARSPQPVLLVADDMARLPATTNLMLVALSSLEPPKGHGWLISCGAARASSLSPWTGYERIELQPVANDLVRAMAERILGGRLDDSLADWVVTRAAGSVRRLKLLLLGLKGARCLECNDKVYKLADGVAWPTSLAEPVIAELGQGKEDDLKLLRAASLLDDPFPLQLAREVAGMSEEEADDSLERLQRMGVVEESWASQNDQHHFASSELRDTLNRGLVDRTRRRMLGKLIHSVGAQSNPGLVGRLQMQCGQNAEALPNLVEGASRCQGQGAFQEALELWNLAMETGRSGEVPEARWKVLAGMGECLLRTGAKEEALRILEPSLSSPVTEDSAEIRGYRVQVASEVARARLKSGAPAQALQQFCDTYLPEVATPQSAWLAVIRARCLERQGKFDDALRTLKSYEGMPDLPATYWSLLGRLARRRSQYVQSCDFLRQGLDACEDLGVADRLEIYYELIESLNVQEGTWEEVCQLSEEALGLARSCQERGWESRFLAQKGRSCELQGDWDEASAAFRAAVESARLGGQGLSESLLAQGQHLLARGALGEAELSLRDVLKQSEGEERSFEAGLGLAFLCLQGQRLEEAREWCLQAERAAGTQAGLGAGPLQLARLLRAECDRRGGRLEESRKLVDELKSAFDSNSYEQGLLLSVRGFLGDQKEFQRAEALLLEAPCCLEIDPLRPARPVFLQLVDEAMGGARRTRSLPAQPSKETSLADQATVIRKVDVGKGEPAAPKDEKAPPTPTPPKAEPKPEGPAPKKSPVVPLLVAIGAAGALAMVVKPMIFKDPTGPGSATPTPVVAVTTAAPSPTPVEKEFGVRTIPEGAYLTLKDEKNNELRVQTPWTADKQYQGKKYRMTLVKDGYFPRTEDIVLDGMTEYSLIKQVSQTVVVPDLKELLGAEFTIDDKKIEFAKNSNKIVLKVAPGTHTINGKAEWREPASVTFSVKEGDPPPDVPIKLAKKPVPLTVVVEGPAGTEIFVDGTKKGTTASHDKKTPKLLLDLPAKPNGKPYHVVAKREGFDDESADVKVFAGKEAKTSLKMHKKYVAPPPPPPSSGTGGYVAPPPVYQPPPPVYQPPPRGPDEF